MNRKIFNMGFSVETISVYLLCCGLADADTKITTKNLLAIWNGSPEALYEGLCSLEKSNILLKIISDDEGNAVYNLRDVKEWKSNF